MNSERVPKGLQRRHQHGKPRALWAGLSTFLASKTSLCSGLTGGTGLASLGGRGKTLLSQSVQSLESLTVGQVTWYLWGCDGE